MLRFAEEIMLLLLDQEGQDFAAAERPEVARALAGGVLMDLALESRIDTDLHELVLLDATPTGDILLDPVLAEIAASERNHDAAYWVERVKDGAGEIQNAAVARLIQRGMLRRVGRFLRTAGARARHVVDHPANREIRGRIMRLVFGNDLPDPRDVVVICLCDVCGLFDHLLTRDELERVRPRIELLGRMDLIGQAVAALVTPG